ncbi:hypothetical protein S83_070148, partial [Arachis hypogaea]
TKHILICINIYRSFQPVPVIFGMFVYKAGVLENEESYNQSYSLLKVLQILMVEAVVGIVN